MAATLNKTCCSRACSHKGTYELTHYNMSYYLTFHSILMGKWIIKLGNCKNSEW